MNQHRLAIVVLLALIAVSCLTGYSSYSYTSRMVNEDMERALTFAMEQQQSRAITQDTIRIFNNNLHIAALRGQATLSIETGGQEFKACARCSEATVFGLSDQRPAAILWILTGCWAMLMWYRRRQNVIPTPLTTVASPGITYGGLTYVEAEGAFYATGSQPLRLTPMQQRLMEMFFHSPTHTVTKAEICDTLWPRKPDASETLYTLIRRIKPVIEQRSELRIESDRSKAYRLEIRDNEVRKKT